MCAHYCMFGAAVVGVGEVPCRPRYDGVDFRELLYQAAKDAYRDAGITADDVDAVVSSGMDFLEGVSISDSYTPDQVGGRLKFNTLVAGDALNAFIHACMMVATGVHEIVAVTAYSKQSDIINYYEILANQLNPHTLRPLFPHPHVIAGLDAAAYLDRVGADPWILSHVAVKNMGNALENPAAAYPAKMTVDEIEGSEVLATPVKAGHVARLCDYAAVVVVARADSSRVGGRPVYMGGFGYGVGSSSMELSLRSWGEAGWVKPARRMMKGGMDVDLVEISEPYAHTELMILSQLEVTDEKPHKMLLDGELARDGILPVNVSGGCLGMGYPPNAAGLQRLVQAVKLLRRDRWKTALIASPENELADAGSLVYLTVEV
jgi:acetyl-CoA C-acetyltransferase